MKSKVSVVISGQIVRNETPSLKSFWNGFINIQKALNDHYDYDFFCHSWNPEYQDLVKSVYNPKKVLHEKQKNFLKLYISKISKIDKLESPLNRATSVWKNCNFQNILGLSISRSKSVNLLKKYYKDYEWSILTRWDQGVSGTNDVNNIIFDPSLSNKFIYMAYYPQIDEGYADMWLVGNKKNIVGFASYYKFVIKCLTGRNNYLYNFSNQWPISSKNSNRDNLRETITLYSKKIIERLITYRFSKKVIKFFKNFLLINIDTFILKILNKNFFSAENSLANGFFNNIKDYESKASWPLFKSINNHAILKYFFLINKKRKFLRFLSYKDFVTINNKGKLINKINYAFVIYSHSTYSDCWEMVVEQTFKHIKKYNGLIYLLSENSLATKKKFNYLFKDSSKVVLIKYNEEFNYTKRLAECLRIVRKKNDFIYFFHEDMPLYADIDEEYLNSLFHFLNNCNEFYIKLIDTTKINMKKESIQFPGLVNNHGGHSLSIQPSIVKLDLFLEFLNAFDNSIYEFEEIISRSNLVFSAVKGERKVGKFALINNKFPHVATAIFKGKWSFSEWRKELKPLLDKYQIDINLRGKC